MTPSTPTRLLATTVSTAEIDLAWSSAGTDTTSYLLERSTPSNGSFAQIASLPLYQTAYKDTGLAAGTRYYYRVRGYNGSTGGSYSAEANATTLGGGSSGTELGWFNVEDYGAVHNGSTDDTAAIQDAIDAADAADGGTIYFPEGIYAISGALQDTSGANCQLKIPSRALSAQEITIRFKGALRPSMMWNTVSTMPPQSNGLSVLKGTLTSQTGTAAMVGGIGPGTGGIFAGADYVTVIFEDLMLEMPTNPSYTCINSHYFGAAFLGVQVHCGEWNVATMTEPTHANAYGVKMTTNNLQGYTHAQGLAVFGFYTGVRLTEFSNADGLRTVGCITGYEVPFMHHPIVVQSMGFYDCPHGIVATGDGDARLTVQNLDIERANHTTSPAWCWSVGDLDDTGNNLYGLVNWISVQGGVGNDHSFYKSGGAHLQCLEMDTFLSSTAPVVGKHVEVAMTGDTPPTPITNAAETDWVYGYVYD